MANTSMGVKAENVVSATLFKSILKAKASAIASGRTSADSVAPILVRGAPGVGKSTIIRDVADELGIDFVDIRLSQRSPEDLKGIPWPDKDSGTTKWFPTDDLPRDPSSKGILLFDEITACDNALQVAAYEIVLERRLGKAYTLPKGWLVVAAGNRIEDRAVARPISSALANRFAHFTMEVSESAWHEWAISAAVHPLVVGFIHAHPDLLIKFDQGNCEQGWPSPRSWGYVSGEIKAHPAGGDEAALFASIRGIVGPGAAETFIAFYKTSAQTVDVLAQLKGEAPFKFPEEADKRYAYCQALTYLVWDADDDQEIVNRVTGLMKILKDLSADYVSLIASQLTKGTKRIPPMKAAEIIFSAPGSEAFFAAYAESQKQVVDL